MALKETVLHLTIFGFNLAVLIRLIMVGNTHLEPPNALFTLYKRFNLRFLTKWTFGVMFTYYTCMVLVHILNSISVNSKLSHKLRTFADAIFTVIVVPAGTFITVAFWSIYLFDRNLIFPSWMEKVIPAWVNHGMHTFNSVLPLVDLFLVKHTFSPWSESIYYSGLYFGSYILCLFGTYFQYGIWLYPIFTKMTFLQSICFCVSGYLLNLVFYSIARLIAINLDTNQTKKKKKTKN
ncbi:androgen-dependent TFPI-regulating protein isoform X2 [Halyomorpha halys]|uniref:androgen-dependent TFPI-regulating protein isoform X2 n=1 Tax=Halyomorpha halys TaxID=286706 RepID=UPI0034D28C2B